MSLPKWFGRSLPCGCVRGVRLCAEAERLWDAVADAHNALAKAWAANKTAPLRYSPTIGSRLTVPTIAAEVDAYGAAFADFTAHVDVKAEGPEQAAML